MGSLIIRNVEDDLKTALKARAAANGNSLQEEAKQILGAALSTSRTTQANLVEAIRRRLLPVGGVEFDLPRRELPRDPPTFG